MEISRVGEWRRRGLACELWPTLRLLSINVKSAALILVFLLGLSCERSYADGDSAVDVVGANLCRTTSDVERLAGLKQFESEEGGPELVDRPWIEACVIGRLGELDAAVDTYCDGIASLSPDEPIFHSRSRSLRHELVRSYQDLATDCRRSNWSLGVDGGALPNVDHENAREQISREWCYDTGELFRTLKRSALRGDITLEQSKCLDRNISKFRAEMDAVCKVGWESAEVGILIVNDWYGSCGLNYLPSQ